MWHYFGRKTRVIKQFPEPRYSIIIEPFAGAACYSLLYPDNQVILNDIYLPVYTFWYYFIELATPQMVARLPNLWRGDKVSDYSHFLSKEERVVMGWWTGRCITSPGNTVSQWVHKNGGTRTIKKQAIQHLEKIKHWKVMLKDYRKIPNIEATWFIDPPFQFSRSKYKCHNIDYGELAEWCKSRKGQVIVCEKGGANWMDFKFLAKFHGLKGEQIEVMWTND